MLQMVVWFGLKTDHIANNLTLLLFDRQIDRKRKNDNNKNSINRSKPIESNQMVIGKQHRETPVKEDKKMIE